MVPSNTRVKVLKLAWNRQFQRTPNPPRYFLGKFVWKETKFFSQIFIIHRIKERFDLVLYPQQGKGKWVKDGKKSQEWRAETTVSIRKYNGEKCYKWYFIRLTLFCIHPLHLKLIGLHKIHQVRKQELSYFILISY